MGFFSKQKLSYILSFAACNERWMDEGGEEKRFMDETTGCSIREPIRWRYFELQTTENWS